MQSGAEQPTLSDPLDAAIHAASAAYPKSARLALGLRTQAGSVFKQQLHFLVNERPDFWMHAERLAGLVEALGNDPAHCLIEYTVSIVKEQVRFLQTGSYGHTDFDLVLEQVYANPEVMQGYYLDGLLLSYAFWPVQYDLYRFFQREFLLRLPVQGVGAEVGFGHGLYLLDVLQARPKLRAHGYDISDSARQYATRLLQHGGVAAPRFELSRADARQRLPVPDGCYDWFVFAEILEHIPDPEAALREVRRCVKPGAPIFLTTVMNSNAMDHLYLYTEIGEVRRQVAAAGLDLVSERVLRVSDYSHASRDPSSSVALICQTRA